MVEPYVSKLKSYARHNHMFAASAMKPGPLRRIGLRVGLWIAGQLALHFSRPGFLTALGVIHFARWVLLPGTDKLLFFSNYDGAWDFHAMLDAGGQPKDIYVADGLHMTPAGYAIWTRIVQPVVEREAKSPTSCRAN